MCKFQILNFYVLYLSCALHLEIYNRLWKNVSFFIMSYINVNNYYKAAYHHGIELAELYT